MRPHVSLPVPPNSPCFHSHSFVELLAPVHSGVLNLYNGRCHLGTEVNKHRCRSFPSPATSQSPDSAVRLAYKPISQAAAALLIRLLRSGS